MVGSSGVAAWIAHVAFWALLLIGVASGELGKKGGALFVALWLAGYVALPLMPSGEILLTPYLAALDIVLVFTVFKGDIRLS
jgi:hypothetical protein